MSGLLWLGQFLMRQDRFNARMKAIKSCLDREVDENRRARLEHALRRVKSEEVTRRIAEAMTTPGFINGKRSDHN
jgi:hypothetical protein